MLEEDKERKGAAAADRGDRKVRAVCLLSLVHWYCVGYKYSIGVSEDGFLGYFTSMNGATILTA